ncbi:hypothetical protein, partial [Microseira wollei]|uniref:hypothetical protein n=1 Tax=Microseira wollei TaxID=467598 RepID=UPI001CFE1594
MERNQNLSTPCPYFWCVRSHKFQTVGARHSIIWAEKSKVIDAVPLLSVCLIKQISDCGGTAFYNLAREIKRYRRRAPTFG